MIQLFIIEKVNSEHYKHKLPKVIKIKSTIGCCRQCFITVLNKFFNSIRKLDLNIKHYGTKNMWIEL